MNIWLYFRSIITSKCIAAILFVFLPGKDMDRVTLDSCTGWVRHIGYFHETRPYEFTLDTQLSRGTAEVILLDKKKRQLMRLGSQFPGGKIDLDAKNRYYLRWEFKNAAGKCELHW